MKGSTAVILHHSHRFTEQLIRQFDDHACQIIFNGNPSDHLSQWKRGHHLPLKIHDEQERETFVDYVRERSPSIDYLVINHLDQWDYRAAIEEFPIEKWREVMEKNLVSTFAIVKAFWPQMKRQHFGRILYLVSDHLFDYDTSAFQ